LGFSDSSYFKTEQLHYRFTDVLIVFKWSQKIGKVDASFSINLNDKEDDSEQPKSQESV
jgi:hypothetical protein